MEAEAEEAMRLANGDDEDGMDVDSEDDGARSSRRRGGVIDRTPKNNRNVQNLTSAQTKKADELRDFAQRPRNYKGKVRSLSTFAFIVVERVLSLFVYRVCLC